MHRPDLSKPRFLFDAQAVPFSAKLTAPKAAEIDPAGATVCSPVGGLVFNRAERIESNGVISIGAAYSQISAGWHEDEKEFNTVVFSVVENVNILNIFTIERAVAAMTVKRSGVMKNGVTVATVNLFDYTGSCFQGLRVCGQDVRVTLRTDLQQAPGSASVLKLGSEGRLTLATKLCSEPAASRVTTLVESSDIPPQYRVKDRNDVINVDGFGRFYLAPVAVSPDRQYLNMFSFDLGCGFEGGGNGGGAAGNGVIDWPP